MVEVRFSKIDSVKKYVWISIKILKLFKPLSTYYVSLYVCIHSSINSFLKAANRFTKWQFDCTLSVRGAQMASPSSHSLCTTAPMAPVNVALLPV